MEQKWTETMLGIWLLSQRESDFDGRGVDMQVARDATVGRAQLAGLDAKIVKTVYDRVQKTIEIAKCLLPAGLDQGIESKAVRCYAQHPNKFLSYVTKQSNMHDAEQKTAQLYQYTMTGMIPDAWLKDNRVAAIFMKPAPPATLEHVEFEFKPGVDWSTLTAGLKNNRKCTGLSDVIREGTIKWSGYVGNIKWSSYSPKGDEVVDSISFEGAGSGFTADEFNQREDAMVEFRLALAKLGVTERLKFPEDTTVALIQKKRAASKRVDEHLSILYNSGGIALIVGDKKVGSTEHVSAFAKSKNAPYQRLDFVEGTENVTDYCERLLANEQAAGGIKQVVALDSFGDFEEAHTNNFVDFMKKVTSTPRAPLLVATCTPDELDKLPGAIRRRMHTLVLEDRAPDVAEL